MTTDRPTPEREIKLPERPEPDGFLTIRIIGREVEVNAYRDSTMEDYARAAVLAERQAAQEVERDAARWRELYRRAVNEANGLTNYVEDRPELRSAERRLDAIQQEARALQQQQGPKP